MEESVTTSLLNLDSALFRADFKEANRQLRCILSTRRSVTETILSNLYKKFVKEDLPTLSEAMDIDQQGIDLVILSPKEIKLTL